MEGIVTNIQKFSIQDGPGIRTTVFLKGCPLRCLWCHNPEGYVHQPQLAYRAAQCIGCRACTQVCPRGCHGFSEDGIHLLDRTHCTACGKCAAACSGALEILGKSMRAEEVLRVVLQDKAFYDHSGGGMTLSGGEPMAQAAFAVELAQLAKAQGLHTAIETSGCMPWEDYEAILPYIDLFLWDYKETDPEKHRAFTGQDNVRILENLEKLNAAGKTVILRCPIIPGCNDRPEHFAGIAATAERLEGVREVHIEPYHPLGQSKAESIGLDYALAKLSFPEEATVQEWIAAVAKLTAKPVHKA